MITCISKYHRPPFCGVLLSMIHLLYTYLSLRHAQGDRDVQDIRHLYPYTTGTPFTYGTKPGAGKRETEHGKSRFEMDGFPF